MNIYSRINIFVKIIIPVLIWINECSSDPKFSDNMTKMKAVKDKILNGYDKLIRPTKQDSNTTEVETGLIPRQILDVDEEKGLFVLDSFFYMAWEDPRLTWNTTTEYNGYMQLPPELLWLPDISIHNSHSSTVDPTERVLTVILPTGTVIWVPPILTKTTCPALSEATRPDDVITCVVQMGSWAHDGWEIDFSHAENLYLSEFLNINSRWELLIDQTQVIRNVTYYEGYNEPYLSLHAVFPIKRKPSPAIQASRNPCILIMLLCLSIFWMPPDSSKKLLVAGISFLALVILMIYVAWVSRLSPILMVAVTFLQSTMYIVVVTFLLQVLVIFNICSISGPVRPPPAAMQLLTSSFAKYAFLGTISSNDIPIDRIQLKDDSPSASNSPTPRDDWLLFAAGLDRLFFVLVSIALISVHHL